MRTKATTIIRLLLAGLLLLAVAACNKGTDSSSTADSGSNQVADQGSQAMEQPETPQQSEDSQAVADAQPPAQAPGMPGTLAPDFTLTDMSGNEHHLADYLASGKTVVLEWFNPGCSVVHYYYQETKAMHDTYEAAKAEMGDDLVWLAVISQDPAGRGGTDDEVNAAIAEWKLDYPLLRDGSGVVGKSFGAEATPTLFIISPDGMIQYNGSVDEFNHGPENPIVGTNFVVQAVHELKSGTPVSVKQREAVG